MTRTFVKKVKRMFGIILITIVTCYVLMGLGLYLFQEKFLYLPGHEISETPEGRGIKYEEIFIRTQDGKRIWGWFVEATNPRGGVLFCHGNAGNITDRMESIEIFLSLNLSVFIFDYRGYGKSDGTPDEQGTYRDVEAAWSYLVYNKKIAPERIVVFGRSLGGPIAAWIASQKNPGALILESTFTSIADRASEIYPFYPIRWMTRIQYPTKKFLETVRCPVLVVHSKNDEMIPFHHGQNLFESAKEPKEFLEIRGDHNNGFDISRKEYTHGLDNFVSKYIK